MNEELLMLTGDGAPTPEAITAFFSSHEFPLVDPRGVTFLYHGEATSVSLRHWVYGLPSSQELDRIDGTTLWHRFLELPQGSRIEYKFEISGDDGSRWITDPLNPLTADDPFGRNSVCRAHGYKRPAWSKPDPNARRGTMESHGIASRALASERRVHIYKPARFRETRRYPLLVVHDGEDFCRFADLRSVLDNLIDRLVIPPMIVALTEPVDRLREYAGDPAHAQFVAAELLPFLQTRYPLLDDPSNRALMGASFGAVASLATAWHHPDVFGKLLLLSGSFAFSDIGAHRRGEAFDPVVEFMNAYRQAPGHPVRQVYIACGIYESLIYENRSLVPMLQNQGLRVRYREVPDGHNWENWRDRLQDGLSWLFPGPLWMIYE